MIIDTHQHFWKYDKAEYAWIDESMNILKRDFLPEHFLTTAKDNAIHGTIAIQARQSELETQCLLELAKDQPLIKGVVGWIDLEDDHIDSLLVKYRNTPLLKGFRHIFDDSTCIDKMSNPNFIRGLKAIASEGYSYDLLIREQHLKAAHQLASKIPSLSFVIDHIAKPKIGDNKSFRPWKEKIITIAKLKNVYCKISGMFTECVLPEWNNTCFTPYMEVVIDAFGPQRIMYGSDWPVCLCSSNYNNVKRVAEEFICNGHLEDYDSFFRLNAETFYQLKD
ncbi:amidohydrolase family protein [bacterium AH-315-K03]|nr:amidohydrolase family protein [bacterium AH-315-K03]